MEIGVYVIKSDLAQSPLLNYFGFFSEIEDRTGYSLKEVSIKEFAKLDFGLVYIATGGSEAGFLEEYNVLTAKPVYILTSGASNSLAASMEILSYLQAKGKTGEILHGDRDTLGAKLSALCRAVAAKRKLAGMKLGVIGKPSDWLIASGYDEGALWKKLGVQVVAIPMEELLSEIAKASYPANPWTAKLLNAGYDAAETEKALHVYGAFRRLVDSYGLGGLTVRCFDLLSSVKTTGCLGLAILNAEGIYAGCEGDIPSLLSMCILGEVSGKPVFMGNPSRIHPNNGGMVLAHCTLPVNMPYEMSLTTHFESGIGVAIAGSLALGDCTVFKTSGDLSRYYVEAGKLTENLRDPTLCRTQIKVELPDYSYFLKNPINNHHIVCLGDERAAVEAFFQTL